MLSVLVIDDDPDLCSSLRSHLAAEGVAVTISDDGADGLERAKTGAFDLIVLDVVLPRMSGLRVIQELRQETTVPIVIVSGRSNELDRIVGLELGADDYLPKPCSPRELVARMRAIRRRMAPSAMPGQARLAANGIVLDSRLRTVECEGRRIGLTPFETHVLERLMRADGGSLTRARLAGADAVDNGSHGRAVDVHVCLLRRKLRTITGRPLITTVRSVGYRFITGAD